MSLKRAVTLAVLSSQVAWAQAAPVAPAAKAKTTKKGKAAETRPPMPLRPLDAAPFAFRPTGGERRRKERRGAGHRSQDALLRGHGPHARRSEDARRADGRAQRTTKKNRASSNAKCSCSSRRSTKRSATRWRNSYEKAIRDLEVLERRERLDAIAAFEEFLTRYPNDPATRPT